MISDIYEWFKVLCPMYAEKVKDYRKEDGGIMMRTEDGYYIHFSVLSWSKTGPRDYVIKVEHKRSK